MIVIKLYGGLGNQMFQYAAAKSIAMRLNTQVVYDDEYFTHPEKFGSQWSYQLDLLKTDVQLWKPSISKEIFYFYYRIIRKLNSKGILFSKYFFEKKHCYDPLVEGLNQIDLYIDGYFQSEKYFKKYRKEIIEEFQPRAVLDQNNKNLSLEMAKLNSVSLHVRRGDYVSNQAAAQVHGTCNTQYYQKAVSYIEEKVDNPHFYVFSDDMAWVKENIQISSQVTYVEHNTNLNSYLDMYLMSCCKHNVIANSSFSWWGAWLNQNQQKIVVTPSRWYLDPKLTTTDIYPDEWLKF